VPEGWGRVYGEAPKSPGVGNQGREYTQPGREGGSAVAFGGGQTDRLAVEYEKEIILVPLEEILYVEASGKYSYVYTEDKRYLVGYSIGELEKRPGLSKVFLRVNRSYLVNVGRVRKVIREKPRKVVVELGGETREFPVGDSYYPSVRSRLNI